MKFLILNVIVILPILMHLIQIKWKKSRLIFHIGALIALLIFFYIASSSVYQIIIDNTVLMTNIHLIFLDPSFLISSFYLGIYAVYQLLTFITDNYSL